MVGINACKYNKHAMSVVFGHVCISSCVDSETVVHLRKLFRNVIGKI